MPAIGPLRCTRNTPMPAGVKQWNLGFPKDGFHSDGTGFTLVGWVVGDPEPFEWLEVTHDGHVVHSVPIAGRRPDVTERFQSGNEHVGFRVWLSTFGMGEEIDLSLVAVAGRRRVPLGSIRGPRTLWKPPLEPEMRPLLVTGYGRSGTTLMMKALRSHPSVVSHGGYPDERRFAGYWSALVRDAPRLLATPLEDPGLRSLKGDPEVMAWFQEAQQTMAERAIVETDRRYGEIAKEHGKTATLFAEKIPILLSGAVHETYGGASEVLMVRDFRDRVCSVLAFKAKRGARGFGRQSASTEADFIRGEFARNARRMADYVRRHEDRLVVVHYEDLVLRPQPTLRRVFQEVGVDADGDTVAAVVARAFATDDDVRRHVTTPTPAASVGRWKRDLPPDLQRLANDVLAEPLRVFGYEP